MLLGGAVGVVAAVPSPVRADDHEGRRRDSGLDVDQFGAVGDGRVDDTRAIQAAIDAAGQRRGGIVRLGPGTWRSGTLTLRSRVTIELARGATLLASPDDDDFAERESLPFSTGSDRETTDFAHALLAGRDLEAVAITGGGVIDLNRDRRVGPKPIALKRCRFVTIRDVTIRRAPNYCVSLGGCEDVVIDAITIREAWADGIDPDCCRRVRISNCDIESDDDALCLKASYLLGHAASTEDVVIANCRLASVSNCFKIGTETTGDFRRIAVSNCVFDGNARDQRDLSGTVEGGGIAIETVDGGMVDGVVVSNVVMTGVPAPLFLRLGNRGRDQRRRQPGRLRNVSITGVVALGARGTGSITGLAEHPVEGVTLDDIRIVTVGCAGRSCDLDVPEREGDYPKADMFGDLPAFGLYVRHARDVILRNVALAVEAVDARSALIADDVVGLHLAGLAGGSGNATGPVVWLHDVRRGVVQGSLAPEGVGVFVRVTGERTRDVALVSNVYRSAGAVELAPELAPASVTQLANVGGEPADATVAVVGTGRPSGT